MREGEVRARGEGEKEGEDKGGRKCLVWGGVRGEGGLGNGAECCGGSGSGLW